MRNDADSPSELVGEGYHETGIQDTPGEPAGQAELRGAKEYAEMIVDTVREALLVLDLDLQVMSANQSFYHLFETTPEETTGHLVYDLGNGQWDLPELRQLLEEILPQDEVFNDFEVEHDFKDLGHRVMLLNARRVDEHELILLAIEDVTRRRRVEQKLAKANESLEARVEERTGQVRELLSALTKAEERERQRLSEILHDDVQQQLYGAEMTGRRMRRLLGRDLNEATAAQLREMCDQLDEILDEAIETTRTLSTELSPNVLGDENLTHTLHWIAEHMQERYGLRMETDVEKAPRAESRELRTLLFRLVREVLFNVVKHAETDRAWLEARTTEEGWLIVQVTDEGKGFDPETLREAEGFGLSNMRERLRYLEGRLELESEPGKGTRLTIALPGSFGTDG